MAAVDRFKAWAMTDEGKEYYRKKVERYGDWEWVKGQYNAMADWVEDNPKEGNKRNWARFVGGWLRRNYLKRVDGIANSKCPGLMTTKQEQDYYNKPREGQTGFVSIKDIFSGKAEKENS